MSFSSNVKEELYEQISRKKHCWIAEISAIAALCGTYRTEEDGWIVLEIHTENEAVAKKCFTLIKKAYNIRCDVFVNLSVRTNLQTGNNVYYLLAEGKKLRSSRDFVPKDTCCKRAYLRGAFLASGSMSDPNKSYHLEFVCSTESSANILQESMKEFEIDAKIVQRKRSYVVYLKDGSKIVDLLNVVGAHHALMEFENLRILKDISNTVNRQVNCETANINKTVSAAYKQTKDIEYIRDTMGLDWLPDNLRDVALTRLQYQEASLKELGELLAEPVGKSGVNHRLRKLSDIAEKLRDNQEVQND